MDPYPLTELVFGLLVSCLLASALVGLFTRYMK